MTATIRQLDETGRIKVILLVMALSFFDIFLLGIRITWTRDSYLIFMVWNLFLALIPYFLGLVLQAGEERLRIRFALPTFVLWILFLPNSPYLLTDMVHLSFDGIPILLWFDLLTLSAFACTGLILTVLTVYDFHHWLRYHLSASKCWWIICGTFYLVGLGVYVGRVLRWNSWEVFIKPFHLLNEGLVHFSGPDGLYALGFVFLFGSFLLLLYGIGYYLFNVFAVHHKSNYRRERFATLY